MARSLQMMVSVGYEYKRFRSICSNHVRHGKCLVMSRNLPAQARHKILVEVPVLSQTNTRKRPGSITVTVDHSTSEAWPLSDIFFI